jgi:hypothetical protein
MTHLKIVVERHSGGYVAYPVGLKGVVVGQGDSYAGQVLDVAHNLYAGRDQPR